MQCLITSTPIFIFSFYQWTLDDAWLPVLFSVLFFLAILVGLLYPAFLILRLAFRSTPRALYTTTAHLSPHAPLYAQYRMQRYYYFLPLLIASFAKALIIAFAQSHGQTQVILVTVTEFLVLLSILVLRPCKDRGGDILASYLAITRLVASGLTAAFLERLSVNAIPRVVIGIVIAVIFSISVVVMFINFMLQLFRAFQSIRASSHQKPVADVTLEKDVEYGGVSERSNLPQPSISRPFHLEPSPYPGSTSPTQSVHENRTSAYSHESRSTMLGSLLPHPHTHSRSSSHSEQSSSPLSLNFAIATDPQTRPPPRTHLIATTSRPF